MPYQKGCPQHEGRSPWSPGSRGASLPSPPPQKPCGFSLACALARGVAGGVLPGCNLEAVGQAWGGPAPGCPLTQKAPLPWETLTGRAGHPRGGGHGAPPWGRLLSGKQRPLCGSLVWRRRVRGEDGPRAGAQAPIPQLPRPWLCGDFPRTLQPPGPHSGPQPSGQTACNPRASRGPRSRGEPPPFLGVSWLPEATSHRTSRLARACIQGAVGAEAERWWGPPFIEHRAGRRVRPGAGQQLHRQLLQEIQSQAREGPSRASRRRKASHPP